MNNAEDYNKKAKELAKQKEAVAKLMKSRGTNNNTTNKLKKLQASSIDAPKEKSLPRMHESEMNSIIQDENSKNCKSVDAQLYEEEGKIVTNKGNQILGNY